MAGIVCYLCCGWAPGALGGDTELQGAVWSTQATLDTVECTEVARWAVPGGPAGGGPQDLVGHVSLDSIWLSVQCHIKSKLLLPS